MCIWKLFRKEKEARNNNTNKEELVVKLSKKKLSEYSVLDTVDHQDIEILTQYNRENNLKLPTIICETEKYDFMKFDRSLISPYCSCIFRISKENPNDIRFMGTVDKICFILSNCILSTETKFSKLYSTNIETGEIQEYCWARETSGYNGHFMSYDYIKEANVVGDHAELLIGRYRGGFRNESLEPTEKDHLLLIEPTNGGFRLTRVFEDATVDQQ